MVEESHLILRGQAFEQAYKKRKYFFRFRLPALLILVAVFLVGYWISYRISLHRDQERAVAVIARIGGKIEYRYQYGGRPHGSWIQRQMAHSIFDEAGVLNFNNNRFIDDQRLSEISRLNLPYLRVVLLAHTRVTDEGIQHLCAFIERNPSIYTVDLKGTSLTDDGITCLADLHGLKLIDLRNTLVTSAGIKQLKSLLPETRIEHEQRARTKGQSREEERGRTLLIENGWGKKNLSKLFWPQANANGQVVY